MGLEQLKDFLREYLKGSNGYQFIEDTLKTLDAIAASREGRLDCQKFADWVASRNVASLNYPISFLRKCGFADIQEGRFDTVAETPHRRVVEYNRKNCLEFLKDNGIKADEDSVDTYCFICELLVNEQCKYTNDEMKRWTNEAVRYLANRGKSANDLLDVMRRSRSMRERGVDVDALLAEKRKSDEELDALMKDIGFAFR